MQNTKQAIKDVLFVLSDRTKAMDARNYPDWFQKAVDEGGYAKSWTILLQACLEEIKMHQDLNGRLYKQLYPSG